MKTEKSGACVKAILPTNEAERLKALYRYGILDTKPERNFDDITLLASHICGTPIALISLVDENRQWFKSKIGLTESETSRDIAFCAHGILQPDLFEVEDALTDERFATNPLVTGSAKIRFYAGSPLVTPDGQTLGMLCVNDQSPRKLSAEQKTALQALGRQVVAQLELRRSLTELQQTIAQLKQAEQQLSIQFAVSRVLAESSTAEEATPKILEVICRDFSWEVGELWGLDHREGVLRCIETWSKPNFPIDEFKILSRQMAIAHGHGLAGRVWATCETAWISDVAEDGNFPRAEAAKRSGLHAAVAFPILIGNHVGGVVEFFSREVREPDEELRRTFTVLGSQLGQFFQRRRLEDQLFQSQKLETVGKLAGGIAHEFNSIMTAIIGQSELLLSDLSSGDPRAKNAVEIRQAADRAATLTRQLLAYGRKQILQPKMLDLNRIILSMSSIFRHMMGGDVDVRVIPALNLRAVKADAGQIEQVVMNMVINARDAMPGGGKLTLEISNATLDRESVGRLPELKPGEYVMLAITDTGMGMSEEVQARIFEPFFSTKETGQGTGLGLATCYGIIKQSGGHISVYSELGRGTTFKIYLPEMQKENASPSRPDEPKKLPHGTETILFVEDDPALREMAGTLLQRLGYSVLTADNGVTALNLMEQRRDDAIDLLFTDVVMPQMDGKALSDRVLALHSETKVLFTSAYTENAIVHQGVLNPGVMLLQKPFTPLALACKIREVLDA